MTRINVISVKELSDQHLMAEYRELPRRIMQKINIQNAPKNYCLGLGHVKWAASHIRFLLKRFYSICHEMEYRGFKVKYSPEALNATAIYLQKNIYEDYDVTRKDIKINKERLLEKYKLKPNFYRWTNRKKPRYYTY